MKAIELKPIEVKNIVASKCNCGTCNCNCGAGCCKCASGDTVNSKEALEKVYSK